MEQGWLLIALLVLLAVDIRSESVETTQQDYEYNTRSVQQGGDPAIHMGDISTSEPQTFDILRNVSTPKSFQKMNIRFTIEPEIKIHSNSSADDTRSYPDNGIAGIHNLPRLPAPKVNYTAGDDTVIPFNVTALVMGSIDVSGPVGSVKNTTILRNDWPSNEDASLNISTNSIVDSNDHLNSEIPSESLKTTTASNLPKEDDVSAKTGNESRKNGQYKCLREGSNVANCSSQGLTMFLPTANKRKVETLILSFNRIQNVTRESFTKVRNLKKLLLDHNEIMFVGRDAFLDLTFLRELDLSHNYLEKLDPDTFDPTPQLFILNLSDNPLILLSGNLWLRSSSLGVLYLNNCNLTSLPDDSFEGVPSLIYLQVGDNLLQELPSQVFAPLSGLRQLYLDHNRLTTLPTDLLVANPQLEWLFVRHNNVALSMDRPFLDAPSLLRLDLEDNNISEVGEMTFSKLQGLQNLTLRKNAIERWAGLDSLPSLMYLDLSCNRLTAASQMPTFPGGCSINLGHNPVACGGADVCSHAGCYVESDGAQQQQAAAPSCTLRMLVRFPPTRSTQPTLLGGEPAPVPPPSPPDMESVYVWAYSTTAATICLCLAITAVVGAVLTVRNRSARRQLERARAAYTYRRSVRMDKLQAVSRVADSMDHAGDFTLRTATVGRSNSSRRSAASSLIAAETPLLAADAAESAPTANGFYGAHHGDTVRYWMPDRRPPPLTASNRLFK